MKTLYQGLRLVGNTAARHPKKARVLGVLLPTVMLLTGYYIGYDLFLHGFFIPIWTPILIVILIGCIQILFSDSRYDKKGDRRGGQVIYRNRITRYSVYLYSAFLLMLCNGNFDVDPNQYQYQDLQADVKLSITGFDYPKYASVEYGLTPIVGKKSKRSKKERKRLRKESKNKTFKMTQVKKRGYIFMGVFFIVFAVLCAAGACVAFCAGGPLGIALGVFALVSILGSITLSVTGFKMYAYHKRKGSAS